MTGFGAAGARTIGTGDVSGLSERTGAEQMREDGGTNSPSGVLGGVSPVSAPDARAHAVSSAEYLGLLHVLVVDDDEAVRRACCQIAAAMGFEVGGADRQTAARAVLKQGRTDRLLLGPK